MSRVRYIDAFECSGCYKTFDLESKAKSCCNEESKRLTGFECKQCFKIYNILEEGRKCCPEIEGIIEIGGKKFIDQVEEHDLYDELLIGGITITDTNKIEVSYV